MSVIPVKTIPKEKKFDTVKSRVTKDIQYAIEHEIYRFEFDGDYNYTYLAGYAKECFRPIFNEYLDNKADELVEKYGVRRDAIGRSRYRKYESEFFKTKRIQLEDRVHVYAEINMNVLLRIYDEMNYDAQESIIRDCVSVIVNDFVRELTQSTTKTANKFSHIENITKICIQSKVKVLPLDVKKINSIASIYLKEKFKV